MKRFTLITLMIFLGNIMLANSPILVAERTFKPNKTEDFYYAFAEGDQIIFDFEMLKGKNLKEIEIIEYPSSSKFMDYETKKIKNQILQVNKTGIYIFRFKEKGMSKKVCKFSIQRIPKDETTTDFNTSVLFETKSKTTYQTKQRKVIDKQYYDTQTSGGSVTVDAQKLGLTSNINHYQFSIPAGTLYWTYRIGVSQEVAKARKQDAVAFQTAMNDLSQNISTVLPKTSLAAYALGYLPKLTVSSAGEDVDYSLVDYNNLQLFRAGQSYNGWIHQKGISVDVQKITNQNGPTSGTYYFTLRNDNQIDNIDVVIEIVTVKQVTTYKTETYQEPNTVTWKVPYMADEYYKRQKVAKTYQSIETDIDNGSYQVLLDKIKEIESLGYNDAAIFSSVGYRLILQGEFNVSKEIFEYGRTQHPNDLYIQGNLAHCYLFLNEFEKAKMIYTEHQYKSLGNSTWKEMVKKDFEEMKAKGISHSDMAKIESLLNL